MTLTIQSRPNWPGRLKLAVNSSDLYLLLLTFGGKTNIISTLACGCGGTAYTTDLKSVGETLRVQISPAAPRRSKLWFACSDFLQKSERAHVAAPPFPQTVTLRSPARLQAPSLRLTVAANHLRAGTSLPLRATSILTAWCKSQHQF